MLGNKIRAVSLGLFVFTIFSYSAVIAADVPVPWGAKLIRDDAAITGGEERKIRTYETSTRASELLSYYLKELPMRGYAIFMQADNNCIFTKGDDLVFVAVPPAREGKTVFMITTASMSRGVDSFRNSQANCESIPGIPEYPGAQCMRSTRLKSGEARSTMYAVRDSIGAVINYYRTTMPQHMWTLDREVNLRDVIEQTTASGQSKTQAGEVETVLNFMGDSQGLQFRNEQGDACYIQVMNNPSMPGTVAVNVSHEKRAKK